MEKEEVKIGSTTTRMYKYTKTILNDYFINQHYINNNIIRYILMMPLQQTKK